jgi:hypothetical protein
VASCDAGWCNVDGDHSNGCEYHIDNNPACALAAVLGAVSGDSASAPLVVSGLREERWYFVTVREDDLVTDEDLGVAITLQSAPGANFDLYVRCGNCSGGLATGSPDSAFLGKDDSPGDSTFALLIEIRWVSGGCDTEHPWVLTVTGDQTSVNSYCN